jgi:peptidoglycan hydrolase CwlO-like protein
MASKFITSKEETSSSPPSSPSPSALKRLKVGDDEVTDSNEMTESGIAAKIANWNKKITAKKNEIKQKQTEVPTLEGQINTKKSEIDQKQKELDKYEEVNLDTDDFLRQSHKMIKMKDELNQELRKL